MELKLLDHTCPTAEENIALDEALLEQAEQSGRPSEVLRLWESPSPVVVIGRSSPVEAEVQREACHARGVPILRRSSGGAAIVAGPGCLMYAVVLSYELRPHLRSIDETHAFVLDTILAGLQPLAAGLARQGTSDMTVGDRKFSGNSMRAKRRHLLYHGTLLYDFPLEIVSDLLATAPRQPRYRRGRDHASFVANLPLSAKALRGAIATAWNARAPLADWPADLTARLVTEKYSRAEWNLHLGRLSSTATGSTAGSSHSTGRGTP